MIQKQSYQITGMRQDNLVGTGNSSKFAHEIKNMRLNTIGDYTTGVWTTEKGTKEMIIDPDPFVNITNDYTLEDFQPIGQAVLNDVWVLFGILDDNKDAIIKFEYKDNNNGTYDFISKVLYYGNLNFDVKHPIECLTYYENTEYQKVYWLDGSNQPRMLNIDMDTYVSETTDIDSIFDFLPSVSLEENVTIEKIPANGGLFPPCTVKYCITYYREYGQESNIVYDSPLYYPTIGDRACSPDELSSDTFKITVTNLDKNHGFTHIRLYSIIRTTEDATPIVRIVEDIPFDNNTTTVEFIDTNTKGSIIDPDTLLFINRDAVVAKTFDTKSNTLFLGNVSLPRKSLPEINIEDYVLDSDVRDIKVASFYKQSSSSLTPVYATSKAYNYYSQLNSSSRDIKVFKYGEKYRLGIQFQDIYGKWSEVKHLKDVENEQSPSFEAEIENSYENDFYKVGSWKVTLSDTLSTELINAGFKKARMVCCYPNNSTRSRMFQGIVSATVKNNSEAENHSPDCSASWFFRQPKANEDDIYDEIQSFPSLTDINDLPIRENNKYKTVKGIYTLNSPELELDDSVKTLSTEGWSLEEVGTILFNRTLASAYVDGTSTTHANLNVKGKGLLNKNITSPNNIGGSYILHPSFAWEDVDVYYPDDGGDPKRQYCLFPFQRRSLNNYIKDVNGWPTEDDTTYDITNTSNVTSKCLGYLISSDSSIYATGDNSIYPSLEFFDSKEVTPTIIDGKVYYGNVNTIAPVDLLLGQDGSTTPIIQYVTFDAFSNPSKKFKTIGGYPIKRYGSIGNLKSIEFPYIKDKYYTGQLNKPNKFLTADPIPITYNSTPHLVFSGTIGNIPSEANKFLLMDVIKPNDSAWPVTSSSDIYTPCGDAVNINSNGSTELYAVEGDHYLMRYDCLKTYPRSTEDFNQIVEIASFFVETRINLDGRYDKNRNKLDNTIMSPINFNLINKSYTQSNNFFSYTSLDPLSAKLEEFPNEITWTQPKNSGEDTDIWTYLTLASVADADGTLGEITKIINNNDNLILFQEHGIAKISFDENTAISTESGIPLELAKTGKYQGLSYLTREVGCQNKWSISLTKNGLKWIDDSRQELMGYGEGIQSLSTIYGFDAYMINELPKMFKTWNPKDFDNFVTYYDKLGNDTYYINKSTCIAWNEQSGTFTSFYDYNNVPYIANIHNHMFMWHNGVWTARENDAYSTFFGNTKDYWMTLVCDGQTDKGSAFPADKVFNNVEYRADIYNLDGTNTNYSKTVFNKQHVWNGYQDSQECNLDGIRKFNTWRVQLPRNYGTRDRIRNPFCYIKLKQNQSVSLQTDRVILHDLAVYFDIK